MVERERDLETTGDKDLKDRQSDYVQETLRSLGPTAKRIMLAQPLNPFVRLEIKILPRGKMF